MNMKAIAFNRIAELVVPPGTFRVPGRASWADCVDS